MAKFMIAISYSKGIVEYKQYSGNINGQKCADFIKNNFPQMFKKVHYLDIVGRDFILWTPGYLLVVDIHRLFSI